MLPVRGWRIFSTINDLKFVCFSIVDNEKIIHKCDKKISSFSNPKPRTFRASILINLYMCRILLFLPSFLSIHVRELYRSLSSVIKSHYLCIHTKSWKQEREEWGWVAFSSFLLSLLKWILCQASTMAGKRKRTPWKWQNKRERLRKLDSWQNKQSTHNERKKHSMWWWWGGGSTKMGCWDVIALS